MVYLTILIEAGATSTTSPFFTGAEGSLTSMERKIFPNSAYRRGL